MIQNIFEWILKFAFWLFALTVCAGLFCIIVYTVWTLFTIGIFWGMLGLAIVLVGALLAHFSNV